MPLPTPWERLAGPDPLGRSLVIAPDGAVPAPWATARRVVVTDPDSPEVVATLHEAWLNRERVVIEVHAELIAPEPVLRVDHWQLSPETDLPGERLDHLIFSHSVDARDPERPTCRPITAALAAGATLATDGPGDVVGPDGVPRWCDGGPLHLLDLRDAVVPAANLAVGSLSTLRSAEPAAELAPDQLEAVTHQGAGARIIAPAGSGKTRVLTERARHLVHGLGIDPAAVCLVAFNVRARAEMQERLTDVRGLEIRTLNSLALAIVAGRPPFRPPAERRGTEVIDERGVRRILDDLVPTRRRAMADPMAVWIEALTATRLGLRSPAAVEGEFGGDVPDFTAIAPRFRDRLRQAGVLDFDEQIVGAIEVLLTDPTARAAARRACRVLLVDEFQDLTPAHVLLVRLLAGPSADVFGVGDDDQTIYGYAGASPEWLIDFTDLFPGAARHDLHVNYRCPPSVIEGARTLLAHNRRRIDKVIEPAPGRTGDSADLVVDRADSPVERTTTAVTELVEQGVAPADIAVLTRVNATLLGPMLALDAAGVPTTAPVGPGFVERTGVAGALAWLRLATSPTSALRGDDLAAAARRPPRGLSPRVIEWISEQRSVGRIEALAGRLSSDKDRLKVLDFAADLERLQATADDADTASLLTAVRDEVGLGEALDRRLDASRRSVDRSAHGDDLAALLAVAALEPDPARFAGWLLERLESIRREPSGVQLSTIHRVKGREWPHVIVHDVSAGLFPHRLSSDVEEERRVFHVAVTRGSTSVRVVAGTPASRFVTELHEPPDPDTPPPTPPVGRPSPGAGAGRTPAPGSKKRREPPPASSIDEGILRERLRTWRSERAKDDGVPAYVVFSDATLYDLADRRPTTDDELLDVSGIGPVKVERYGAAILGIISSVLDGD